MPPGPNLDPEQPMSLLVLVDPLYKICTQAAQAILPIYELHRTGGDAGISAKVDRSPLTAADRASHDVIARELAKRFPSIPVVSEEGATNAHGDALHWLVDPLDGTKEFLKANDQFTINIALVDGGRPIFGMVLVPVDGRAYAGIPSVGAWRRDATRSWQRIQVAPVYRDQPCRVVVSGSHRDENIEGFLAGLRATGLDVQETSVGSSLKLCQVAEGAAHVYPRLAPTMHWDTAAAHAVVEGAGGSVVDEAGAPLRYGHGDLRNPWFIAGGQTRWPWHDFVVRRADAV